MRIKQNKNDFPKSDSAICATETHIRNRIADNLGMERDEVHDLMSRMLKCEEVFIIPKILNNLKNSVDGFSMMNPLSPHGMIIIGYLVNTIAMKVLTGRA